MTAPGLEHFDFDPIMLKAAARNWRLREQQRESNKIKIATGRLDEVEPPERIEANARFREKAVHAKKQSVAATMAERSPVLDIFQERVIGDRDFLGIEFLEMASAVSRFVGRVHIRTIPGKTQGYGTGFVVSPRLLLTNNHVLSSADMARHSHVEFDYQKNRFGQPMSVVACALEPDVFFLTDRRLDFTLVAISERSINAIPLKNYTWVRLYPDSGKALIGDSLNIIQHPSGEMKQLVLRSNKLVDNFDDFVHYETDTEPGSSGSPVFSDAWFVVALHHSGVPRTDSAGGLLDVDGRPWREGRDDPRRLAWVGNEGIRVSSIIRAVEKAKLVSATQRELRRQLLELDPPHPLEPQELVDQHGAASSLANKASASSGAVNIVIPLHVSVSFGTPELAGTATQVTPTAMQASQEVPRSEMPDIRNGGGGAKRRGDDAKLAERDANLEAAHAKFGHLPGVLGVELGYAFKDGWITDERAIVVTVRAKRKNGTASGPALPDTFQGLPVQTTGPSIEDLVALRSGRAVAESVFAEAVATEEIIYTPPTGTKLETITDTMRVIAHLSPDAGWPQLKKFLSAAKSSLTVVPNKLCLYIFREEFNA